MGFKVGNEELKNELMKYIRSCEFQDVKNNKGEWKRKIKKRGEISEKLAQMIWTIAQGLSMKENWRGYTWREDFISQGVLITFKYMHNFNPEIHDNAHGYINKICYNAFAQFNKSEKIHSQIKQTLYDRKDGIEEAVFDESALDYEDLVDTEYVTQCKYCGKKGISFSFNEDGLCEKCTIDINDLISYDNELDLEKGE